MKIEEYKDRIIEIRALINTLADEMGATYSTGLRYIEKIINDAVNGNLDIDGDINIEEVFGNEKKYFGLIADI